MLILLTVDGESEGLQTIAIQAPSFLGKVILRIFTVFFLNYVRMSFHALLKLENLPCVNGISYAVIETNKTKQNESLKLLKLKKQNSTNIRPQWPSFGLLPLIDGGVTKQNNAVTSNGVTRKQVASLRLCISR